ALFISQQQRQVFLLICESGTVRNSDARRLARPSLVAPYESRHSDHTKDLQNVSNEKSEIFSLFSFLNNKGKSFY
ncbi:MAG: hypothetical protein OSJ74_03015, partial [Clostridia bacterium]|nr:hypothetical protein [Clostridia bacterium]